MTDNSDNIPRILQFSYKNWRGETSTRTVTPKSIRFGATDWHPEEQWLMLAYDHDKDADREFALKDCVFREDVVPRSMLDKCRETVRKRNTESYENGPLLRKALREAREADDAMWEYIRMNFQQAVTLKAANLAAHNWLIHLIKDPSSDMDALYAIGMDRCQRLDKGRDATGCEVPSICLTCTKMRRHDTKGWVFCEYWNHACLDDDTCTSYEQKTYKN